VLAAVAGVALGSVGARKDGAAPDAGAGRATVRQAVRALRRREVARWLSVLEVSNLLLDVLTGFLGVYLVDVAHATPAEAGLGVALRLGASLAGDVLLLPVPKRAGSLAVLHASVRYPGTWDNEVAVMFNECFGQPSWRKTGASEGGPK
jgi:hypothetical protein